MSGYEADILCPWCATKLECHDGLTGAAVPKTGDVALCWTCRNPGVFENGPFGVVLRRPDALEAARVKSDLRAERAFAAMAESANPHDAVSRFIGGSDG